MLLKNGVIIWSIIRLGRSGSRYVFSTDLSLCCAAPDGLAVGITGVVTCLSELANVLSSYILEESGSFSSLYLEDPI